MLKAFKVEININCNRVKMYAILMPRIRDVRIKINCSSVCRQVFKSLKRNIFKEKDVDKNKDKKVFFLCLKVYL